MDYEAGLIKNTTSTYYERSAYCQLNTQVITTDSITGNIVAKEIKRYNCLGAYTAIIDCKKWKLENGKLKRQKTDCKGEKF